MTRLHDPEGRQQFTTEVRLPTPHAAQRRERREHVECSDSTTEVALDAPDSRHRLRINIIPTRHGVEYGAILLHHPTPVVNPLLVDHHRDIVPDRQPEFRLRVQLAQDERVRAHTANVLPGARGDTSCAARFTQRLQASLERIGECTARQQQRDQETCEQMQTCHLTSIAGPASAHSWLRVTAASGCIRSRLPLLVGAPVVSPMPRSRT